MYVVMVARVSGLMNQNDRSIVVFTGLSHAAVHTFELSIPILVVIWLVEFPVTTATIGLVVSVGYALFGIGALPGGVLADRYGSRVLILGCLFGMAVSFLALSFAGGVWTICGTLVLWGIAASVYHPSGLSLISKGVEDRGTAFAYHGMAGNIGIAFGPLVTALLLLVFDWRVVSRLLVIPAFVTVAYGLRTEFDERAAVSVDGGTTQSSPKSIATLLADSQSLFTAGFTLAMVIVMMNGLFYRATLTFLPEVLGGFLPPFAEQGLLFDPDSPLAEKFDLASYLYAGLLMVGIVGQYVAGKASDTVEPTRLLPIVFGALAIVAIGFTTVSQIGIGPLLAVSGLLGFLLFALQPLYQSIIAEQSPPGSRGLSYGYTYLLSFGIGASGAALAGYLLSVATTEHTFLLLACIPAFGAVFSVLLRRWSTNS